MGWTNSGRFLIDSDSFPINSGTFRQRSDRFRPFLISFEAFRALQLLLLVSWWVRSSVDVMHQHRGFEFCWCTPVAASDSIQAFLHSASVISDEFGRFPIVFRYILELSDAFPTLQNPFASKIWLWQLRKTLPMFRIGEVSHGGHIHWDLCSSLVFRWILMNSDAFGGFFSTFRQSSTYRF